MNHYTFDTKKRIVSASGADINCYVKHAASDARCIVHINHGLAEHAERYARFATKLSEAGCHVYAHDHRGHGLTKAKDAPQGVFSLDGDGVKKVMLDCAAVQENARAHHPDLPLIMFGHSMGGLITMNYALAHADRLAGAAVWNSNFSGGLAGRLAQGILHYERFRLGSDVPSRILPKLTFETWGKKIPNHRTDFDWLSHIEKEVDAYIADPNCGWNASVSMWQDLFDLVFNGSRVRGASKKTKILPIQLLGGGKDPATDNAIATQAQCKRLKAAGFTAVKKIVFPSARHETLNDEDQDAATEAFIVFLHSCTDK
ncbi:alpha/beta fold hydrolase [Ahrensia sp. 13_GOM-1096m]|uniref:alpha/beta fold hydrolase n=1 Tax=Ahrensia sp. 13_GOM-1096m TaxID=1380380 RepID=UPI00047A5A8B|nr:alpha/beta hydrolase [Ahrensia sp. 13_GOM-1096m]